MSPPESGRYRFVGVGDDYIVVRFNGQVVRIETTNLVYIWQNALNLRAQLWAGRDFAQSIAVIRNDRRAPAPWPDGVRLPNCMTPRTSSPFRRGTMMADSIPSRPRVAWPDSADRCSITRACFNAIDPMLETSFLRPTTPV